MQKGKMFFNIIIAITVIAFISVGGFLLYYHISNYFALKEAEEAVAEFENNIIVVALDENENIQEPISRTGSTRSTKC